MARRIDGLIRDLPDTNVAVPGSEWTVGESAAHLAITKYWFARVFSGEDQLRYGEGTIDSLVPTNARTLAEFNERDGARLADLILERTGIFLEAASTMPSTRIFETPMGRMDTVTTASYMATLTRA